MNCYICSRRIHPTEIYLTFYYCYICDTTYDYEREIMDKKIKKIISQEKDLEKKTKSLLKEDKKHDKVIAKAEKKIKGKK